MAGESIGHGADQEQAPYTKSIKQTLQQFQQKNMQCVSFKQILSPVFIQNRDSSPTLPSTLPSNEKEVKIMQLVRKT